jgi:hypothetical protein
MAAPAAPTYTCQRCVDRNDADRRLHEPNFWNGRTLHEFLQKLEIGLPHNAAHMPPDTDRRGIILDFGIDLEGYTIAPGGVDNMFNYLMSVRALLVHGAKMAKGSLCQHEMMNFYDVDALHEALAVVAADELHRDSNGGNALSKMPNTGALRDNLRQKCDLCSGAWFPDSATFQAHSVGNRHIGAFFRTQTLCPTCGWSAVGRGSYEHMSGKKHRAKIIDVFIARKYIIAAEVAESSSSSSSAPPAKRQKQ